MSSKTTELQRSPARLVANGQSKAVLVACHTWFHELIGGSSKVATELAEHLAAEGHRVCYVCGTHEPEPVAPSVIDGVELWRYPFPRARSPHPANVWGHIARTYRLTRRILRQSRVACVSGHTPLQFLGASLAARGRCDRQVYNVHSPFDEELASNRPEPVVRLRDRLALHVARRIEAANCRRADTVRCDSRYTAALLAEKYGERVSKKTDVTSLWVDTEVLRPVADAAATRAMLGPPWRSDIPVFFTVRRLEARMGLDALVDAAAILKKQGFGFQLLIGGGGSMEETLRSQIVQRGLSDTAHLLGRVPAEQLPRCYAAADCFVLPTRALECFGLIILESYACARPVIATPVGAIPELVNEYGSEWLTSGTSPADLADRMAAFLRGELKSDPARLRALAERYSADAALAAHRSILLPESSGRAP